MFLNLGYSNEWWHKYYGFRFDESLYRDPLAKLDVQNKINCVMREKFSRWGFLEHLDQTNVISRFSVDIEPYGHRFIPAMFGAPIRYADDQTPWAHTIKLEDEYIMSLEPMKKAEFMSHPLVEEIVRQHHVMKDAGKICSAQQNIGSVINTAIYLRGDDLFYDFTDKPEVIHKLFSLITNMLLLSYDYFSEIDNYWPPLGIGNCSVAMLSPRVYKKFCLPCDKAVMEHAKKIGVPFAIHQDSLIDPFIPVYKEFDYLSSFDIGCDSNVALFRENYPHLDINIFLYTSTLRSLTAGQLYDLILKQGEEGKPYSKIGFSVYDIDLDVTDDKIESICDAFTILKEKEKAEKSS